MEEQQRLFVLDSESIRAFQELYPGRISDRYNFNTIALGYVEDEKPVGLIVCQLIDKQNLLIEWLYVSEDYQRRGIGSALLQEILKMGSKEPQLQWINVLCHGEDMRLWLMTKEFYVEVEASFVEYQTTLDKLLPLPETNKTNIKRLKDVTDKELRLLNHKLGKEDIAVGITLPVLAADYLEQSLVYVENNEVMACILFQKDEESINVSYLYSNDAKITGLLIGQAQKLLAREYGETCRIQACGINETSQRLIRKLFNNPSEQSIYMGKKYNNAD